MQQMRQHLQTPFRSISPAAASLLLCAALVGCGSGNPSVDAGGSAPSPGLAAQPNERGDGTTAAAAAAPLRPEGHDWPNWRGPRHDGISRETNWRSDWDSRPPQRLWKTNVGTGFSSVSVVGDRLFTMGNRPHPESGEPHDFVFCRSTETGEAVWEHSYPCEFTDGYHEGGPGSTPTVEGELVFTLGRRGQLFCLQSATGAVVWSQNLADDLGVEMGEWGFTCSPLVLGEKLLVEAGRTAAYDKRTGERLWQTKKFRPGYGSPVPFQHQGETLIAVLNNDALVVLRASDGTILDEYPWETSYVTTSATPIVSADTLFISSGYNKGCALVRLEGGQLKYVYENRLMRNHFNNSVLYDGKLYGMDGNSHSARLVQVVCMDWATGRVHWSERGFGCGSLTVAGDKLLILSDDGQLAVAEASPKQYRELGRVQALRGRCWTVPVLAHGRIYCRNAAGNVVCLEVRNRSAGSPAARPE